MKPAQWLANGLSEHKRNQMNNQPETLNQRLTLISKKGGIHVGWVEEPQASPAPTQPIQLELSLNQSRADNNWLKAINN